MARSALRSNHRKSKPDASPNTGLCPHWWRTPFGFLTAVRRGHQAVAARAYWGAQGAERDRVGETEGTACWISDHRGFRGEPVGELHADPRSAVAVGNRKERDASGRELHRREQSRPMLETRFLAIGSRGMRPCGSGRQTGLVIGFLYDRFIHLSLEPSPTQQKRLDPDSGLERATGQPHRFQ